MLPSARVRQHHHVISTLPEDSHAAHRLLCPGLRGAGLQQLSGVHCLRPNLVSAARRFAVSFLVVYLCWDMKPIFYALWGFPGVRWLMVYTDPRHPSDDALHGVCVPSMSSQSITAAERRINLIACGLAAAHSCRSHIGHGMCVCALLLSQP